MSQARTIDLIAGARPNFVKLAAIVRAMEAHRRDGGTLRYRIVHTGQHYDPRLSGDFFEQLGIPAPDVNLDVGSGTQAEQTAALMIRYEALLLAGPRPSLTLVVGDVTSTMACALVARKLHVPVAHVEAGIRSGDWTMPEEINRVVTDAITNWFFTTSTFANEHLRKAGVAVDQVFFVGNTMIDTLLTQLPKLIPPSFAASMGLEARRYLVLTLHRPANVDDPHQLGRLLSAVGAGVRGLPVIFPVHPRTEKVLRSLPAPLPEVIRIVEPQPYLQFNWLAKNALAMITDSGGVTEETTVLGVPCMTLRDSTERPETVSIGTNELLGTDPAALSPALDRLFTGLWKRGEVPALWDGKAGERIVAHLAHLLRH